LGIFFFCKRNPSHLASTKEWPKLRFASHCEQPGCFRRLTNTYAWFFIPEQSGIGEIGGCSLHPSAFALAVRIVHQFKQKNASAEGETVSSFLCVFFFPFNAVTANAFVVGKKKKTRLVEGRFLMKASNPQLDLLEAHPVSGQLRRSDKGLVTWLILPVVICLSQRLSHACLSIRKLYCETANGSLNQL
jgi:hypothetical protein